LEYEFDELEQIVTVLINPLYLSFEKQTKERFEQVSATCKNEVEKIKKRFNIAILKAVDENCIRVYIHRHQSCLINFSDTMYVYLRSNKLQQPEHEAYAQSIVACYEEIYECINNLLLYLEKHYHRYFDLDERLTKLCNEEFAKAIKSNLDQLKRELKRNEVNDDLIKITSDPFEKLQSDSATISYRKRNYLQVLLLEILTRVNDKDQVVTTDQICDLLLSLNYNNTRFFNFIIYYYGSVARDLDNAEELLGFYFFKKKLLNQLAIIPMMAFNNELPDIREQIANWFTEEIAFLERKQWLSSVNGNVKQDLEDRNTKIHTTLAVSQLSFSLKLLIDSGIFINCNYTELTKMVARNFKTDRMENISEGSLRNKYYNIEKGTTEKMKDLVFDLLNMVRKY